MTPGTKAARPSAEKGESATASNWVAPPPVQLDEAMQLARLGKCRRIEQWARTLADQNPRHHSFALHIESLAKDLKDREIIDLLTPLLEARTGETVP